MARAYQYDANGYYAGACEDYGMLPSNSTRKAPQEMAGHIPRWQDGAWSLAENHIGEKGWLDGEPFTVREYGPLPAGFSSEAPPKTQEELFGLLRSGRDSRLARTDYLLMPDYQLEAARLEKVKAYRQALRDLPAMPGAPWDGGGEQTPWPVQDW